MADETPGTETAVSSATVTTDTKHTFGLDGFSKQTPMFAKNLFIVFYSMNTGILGWIGYSHLFSQSVTYELVGLFKFMIDPLCFTLSRMWGVTAITQDEKGN